MNDDDLEVFALFVQHLNDIGLIDLLLKVGDPNVAAQKWKQQDLVISAGGSQEWYKNDKLHRNDGPAVICANGYQAWYQNGKQVNKPC